MLYIPCTYCGFNNAVKSETTLFCEKCSKKLVNNFRDWHKQHPDKTFDNFSKNFCISDFDLLAQGTPQKKYKTSKIAAIVLISIFFFIAIVGAIGYWGVKHFLNQNLTTKTSESVLTGNWKQTPVGTSGLSVELPFALDKQDINLSETVKSAMDTMESFSHVSDNGFKVLCFYSAYKSGITTNLDAAVDGAISESQKLPGISDFDWSRTDTVIDTRKAALVSAQYKLLTYSIRLRSLIVCDKNHLWQIVTQYSDDDLTGKKAAEKILSSVRFDPVVR